MTHWANLLFSQNFFFPHALSSRIFSPAWTFGPFSVQRDRATLDRLLFFFTISSFLFCTRRWYQQNSNSALCTLRLESYVHNYVASALSSKKKFDIFCIVCLVSCFSTISPYILTIFCYISFQRIFSCTLSPFLSRFPSHRLIINNNNMERYLRCLEEEEASGLPKCEITVYFSLGLALYLVPIFYPAQTYFSLFLQISPG